MNPTSKTQNSSEEQQKQGGLSNNHKKLTSIISPGKSEKKLPTKKNGKSSSYKKRSCKSLGTKTGESSTKRRGGSLVGREHEIFVTKFMADAWDNLMHAGDGYEKTSKGKEALQKHIKHGFSIEHESGGSNGSNGGGDGANATQAQDLNDLYDIMAQQYASVFARMDGLEALFKDMMELLKQKNDQ